MFIDPELLLHVLFFQSLDGRIKNCMIKAFMLRLCVNNKISHNIKLCYNLDNYKVV